MDRWPDNLFVSTLVTDDFLICQQCRHSDASNRPLFSAIFKMLGHLDSDLLSWTEKDKAAHPQAASLGAPLEAGDELYTDLQDYYLDEASKRQ